MAMIDVNKLKVGVTYEEEGQPFKVLKYEFTKMGRGNANIKVKVRNLITGATLNKSYLSGNRVEEVELVKKEMQYLYKNEDKAYFMNPKSFEQIELNLSVLGSDIQYLVEGENTWVVFWGERILGVEIPASVILKVKETEPGVKGDSAVNVYKPAVLESGLKVQVPLFIREGDKIKVNTATGEYVARAN